MGVDMFDSHDFHFHGHGHDHDHVRDFDDDDEDHLVVPLAGFGTMELVLTIVSVVGIIIVLILLCKCCQRSKYRGQVINPPPVPPGPNSAPTMVTVAPYPQQQYITPAAPMAVVHQYPYAAGAFPPGAAYPHPHPLPPIAPPSAPDANVFFGIPVPGWNSQALPPSYEQATGAAFKHSTPYNPNY